MWQNRTYRHYHALEVYYEQRAAAYMNEIFEDTSLPENKGDSSIDENHLSEPPKTNERLPMITGD